MLAVAHQNAQAERCDIVYEVLDAGAESQFHQHSEEDALLGL
jgi:hypothetical protein